MADIFLSYASEESNIAITLVQLFECEGWSCWWDRPNISLGEDFRPIIRDEIDKASVVLVLWSSAARRSKWVDWEVEQAKRDKKLLEFVVRLTRQDSSFYKHPLKSLSSLLNKPISEELVNPSREDGLLKINSHPQIPPMRDEVLRRVSEAGGLTRRCDGWNSRLHIVGWRDRCPKRPIIGWEWVNPDKEEVRLVRRERWTEGAAITYGTTIGNCWQFGIENTKVPIGYILIKRADHHVNMPKIKRFLGSQPCFLNSFSVEVRLTEFISENSYPGGGVNLELNDNDSP